ncbi:aminotransferase class I/II-fold pyridoxal phosphate-dependent enzyme [bacterium]|nr:aminotransferase class I/II-fold pyridoxal phosphate-dependent enzyme [bacterium]
MNISQKINKISKSKRILFTTPSHDRTSFIIPNCRYSVGKVFYNNDLSEINGLDNLAEPEDIILQSMKKSADLIGVDNVFYLINGSSSGIIASMLSVLRCNDKVLIARNCHKSVINGLILSGAEPIWFLPDYNENWGIYDKADASVIEKFLSKNSDIKAVIITSPTYEGINSDIKKIAKICHQYNTILIVDEAHGALKSFAPNYFGDNAVKLGADISVQSLHKTCGAPNPCALLLCNNNIQPFAIQNCLNLINTTSPSFPLISAIEDNINYLFSKDGQIKIYNLVKNINNLKNKFSQNDKISFCDFNDLTKMLVKINGLTGIELSDILFEQFNIEDELANYSSSLLLTGIGTTKYKLKYLEKALNIILAKEYFSSQTKSSKIFLSKHIMTPREAFFAKKVIISTENSIGRICAEIVSSYPPGIPSLIPGEEINENNIIFLKDTISVVC